MRSHYRVLSKKMTLPDLPFGFKSGEEGYDYDSRQRDPPESYCCSFSSQDNSGLDGESECVQGWSGGEMERCVWGWEN